MPEQALQTAYALLCGDATPAALRTLASLCALAGLTQSLTLTLTLRNWVRAMVRVGLGVGLS